MARVPYIDMATLDPIREDPTPYNPDFVTDHNLHRAMSNHPELVRVFWPRIGTWLATRSTIERRLREFAIITASYVTASGYEFAWHASAAEKDCGFTHEDLLGIIAEANGEKSNLNELERNVCNAARDLTLDTQINDATWSFLEKELGVKRLLELVVTTSYYNHVIRVVAAVQISIEGENGEADRAPYLERYSPPKHIGTWR
jgi:alkylhydroperoxidase family enzyme